MGRMRVAIVDDEPLARARLARLLRADPTVALAGEYGSVAGALAGLQEAPVDALFLDVRMPGADGFALLDALPAAIVPLVVFVTAFSEHAVQAFDARAVDYLLKPIGADRLQAALARLAESHDRRASRRTASYLERLAVPDGARLKMVSVAAIECLLARGNYVEIHVEGRMLQLRETLARLHSRLDPARFVRIHRSRVVRIDLVDQVEHYASGQYVLRLRGGTRVLSGRNYAGAVRAALGLAGAERCAVP